MKTHKNLQVYHSQTRELKVHAKSFADALNELDQSYVLKGRRLVDCFAKICGYNNYGELVVLAKRNKESTPLRLFSPKQVPYIATSICNLTGFRIEIVIAAMIKAAMSRTV